MGPFGQLLHTTPFGSYISTPQDCYSLSAGSCSPYGKTDSASHGFFVTQRLGGLLWHLEYSEIMIYVFYEHLLP